MFYVDKWKCNFIWTCGSGKNGFKILLSRNVPKRFHFLSFFMPNSRKLKMSLVYLLSDIIFFVRLPPSPMYGTSHSLCFFPYTVCYSIDLIVLNYFPFSLSPCLWTVPSISQDTTSLTTCSCVLRFFFLVV